jgi:hypothetical protein
MDLFETAVLNRVVDQRVDDTQWLVDTFFPEISLSEEETIYFDKTTERQLITPFVSPLVEGRIIADQGYETDSFKPAYAKDKRAFDPNKAFRRLPGEQIGGSLSPAQRLQAKVAFALDEQIKMLNRRFEVMAGDVLVNGSATISGERYPTKVVNFGRDASLRKVLAGGAVWTAGATFMIQNIEDWGQAVQDLTGIAPNTVVMTTDAWALLKTDPAFKGLISTIVRELAPASIATGPTVKPRAGPKRVGTMGDYELYTYSGTYTDPEDGAVKHILPPMTVLVGSTGIDGVRHFGAIRDLKAGIQARQYFVKSWEERTRRGASFSCRAPRFSCLTGPTRSSRQRWRNREGHRQSLPHHRDGGLKPSAPLR